MFGIRRIATKCKDSYFDSLAIECNVYYHGYMAEGLHVIYVSIKLSPVLV